MNRRRRLDVTTLMRASITKHALGCWLGRLGRGGWLVTTILLAGLLSPYPSPAVAQDTRNTPELTTRITRLVEQANQAIRAGRMRQARRKVERIFRSAPLVALEVSDALLRHPAVTEHDAARFLSMAENAPRSIPVWRTIARAHWILGDPETALTTLAQHARLLSQDEHAAALLVLIAAREIETDGLERATRCLELARRLRPQDGSIVLDLAGLWVAQGDGGRAVRLLRWRLGQHPTEVGTARQLARTLLGLGEMTEAVSLWRQLANSNGSSADWASAAQGSLAGGDATQAFLFAERALALTDIDETTEIGAQLAKGLAAAILGRPDEARPALTRVLALQPGHLTAQNALDALRVHSN